MTLARMRFEEPPLIRFACAEAIWYAKRVSSDKIGELIGDKRYESKKVT